MHLCALSPLRRQLLTLTHLKADGNNISGSGRQTMATPHFTSAGPRHDQGVGPKELRGEAAGQQWQKRDPYALGSDKNTQNSRNPNSAQLPFKDRLDECQLLAPETQ